ncbi:protease modulator HflC [Tropicimonas isoalkanivorans]|uniref:Protease FtsH subunit HflC n=1 Tax=Tropicimonas isoalkanivorans TaxID=441112 RepID=A0A1I1JKI4_9RHOB|nr:protease modulator HflC [Tropicimonas isoalkanivorans]SFC48492.1 protease FtsH subunit HflC [Tropicimonas isoalkanivorans]
MNRPSYVVPLIAAVIALVLLMSSIFIVDEREKALVLQFGQIKRVKEEPGLAFKVPLIQEVVRYDDRILALDTDTIEVTPSDDRRLVVDAFARYRIADVVRFRQAVGGGGLPQAESRLSGILNAQIREVLGADQVTSDTILSEDRRILMNRIRDQSRAEALSLGLDVVDVRLKQTNLPEQNLNATFERMRAEREREAADEIARGNEAAQRVRAQADRTVVELVSDARKEAEIVRGEADATRTTIYADAFGADPNFFAFFRSLSAYEAALKGENSSLVIAPDSEFFEYFGGALGSGTALVPSAAGVPDTQSSPESTEGSASNEDMGASDMADPSEPADPASADVSSESTGAATADEPASAAPSDPAEAAAPAETTDATDARSGTDASGETGAQAASQPPATSDQTAPVTE